VCVPHRAARRPVRRALAQHGEADAALLQPLEAFYAAESDPRLKRDALDAFAQTRTLAHREPPPLLAR